MKKHYAAPWSKTLKLFTGALLLLSIIGLYYAKDAIDIVIIGTIIVCTFLSIQGYSINNGQLLIHRLGWAKRFDLSTLTDIEFTPNAMMGSIRTWGIGGLFGYIGYFRNSILGTYRAYATNQENTVVLDFKGKKVVITPDSPTDFVEKVHSEQPGSINHHES